MYLDIEFVYCDGIPTDEDMEAIKKMDLHHLIVLSSSSVDQKETIAQTIRQLELYQYKAIVDCVCVDLEEWNFEQAKDIVSKQMGRLIETGIVKPDLGKNKISKDLELSKWESQIWTLLFEAMALIGKPVTFKRILADKNEAERIIFYTEQGSVNKVQELVKKLESNERLVEGLIWPGVEVEVYGTLSLDNQYQDKLILVCQDLIAGSSRQPPTSKEGLEVTPS